VDFVDLVTAKSETPNLKQLMDEVLSQVLAIYYRAFINIRFTADAKDPYHRSFSPDFLARILNKDVLDLPIMLDLTLVYGRTNEKSVKYVLKRAFELNPNTQVTDF